jgi:DNA-binding PadR family transcriptional regulator
LLSDKGREVLRRWLADLRDSSGQWDQWNESAQLELERIQAALNQIAQSLEPNSELGQ